MPVLFEVMRRADTGINISFAVTYECVRTVCEIYPNDMLLDAAASAITQFITSDNHSLKCIGVDGLSEIVQDNPKYAAAHQMTVMDCLDDPDEALKRKTIALLFHMTNPVNAEVIVDKLLEFLKKSTDVFLRKDLATRIVDLCDKFSSSNLWYIETMTQVLEVAGTLLRSDAAETLMLMLSEGADEDDEADDDDMRTFACEMFIDLLDNSVLPKILLTVVCWTLGEYSYSSAKTPSLGQSTSLRRR